MTTPSLKNLAWSAVGVLLACQVLTLLFLVSVRKDDKAMASRKTSPGIGIQVKSVVFHRVTQLTTVDTVSMFAWRPPQNILVTDFSVRSRAKGGTHVATLFELKNAAVVVASVDVAAIAAGARGSATSVPNPTVLADTELTVDFTETGGTTPTLDDVSIQIDYVDTY